MALNFTLLPMSLVLLVGKVRSGNLGEHLELEESWDKFEESFSGSERDL